MCLNKYCIFVFTVFVSFPDHHGILRTPSEENSSQWLLQHHFEEVANFEYRASSLEFDVPFIYCVCILKRCKLIALFYPLIVVLLYLLTWLIFLKPTP